MVRILCRWSSKEGSALFINLLINSTHLVSIYCAPGLGEVEGRRSKPNKVPEWESPIPVVHVTRANKHRITTWEKEGKLVLAEPITKRGWRSSTWAKHWLCDWRKRGSAICPQEIWKVDPGHRAPCLSSSAPCFLSCRGYSATEPRRAWWSIRCPQGHKRQQLTQSVR